MSGHEVTVSLAYYTGLVRRAEQLNAITRMAQEKSVIGSDEIFTIVGLCNDETKESPSTDQSTKDFQ